MRKIDLENDMYNSLLDYLYEKFRKQNIRLIKSQNVIIISSQYLYLKLNYSYNENKIYFTTGASERSFIHLPRDKYFRVFRLEDAIKYIDYRLGEEELIRSIAG